MDEFEQVQSAVKAGTRGWWEDVMPRLSEKQLEDLERAAGSRSISHRTISTVLNRWGFEVTIAQVGHWRRNYVR